MKLGEKALAAGYRLQQFAALGSTNDEAMSRLALGDPGRLWIVADEQSRGRGRFGRQWRSPPGNLYASLLLVDPAPPPLSSQLSFVAGVALAGALQKILGGDARLKLKWPNDALYDGAKLSGLLLDGACLANGLFGCVIGFGVNCQSSPGDAPYPTASLKSIGAAPADRETLFPALTDAVADGLDIWARGENFAAVRAAWLGHAGGIGGPVRVSGADRAREGIFRGVDACGRMLLEAPDGAVEIVEAGDVDFGRS
ncbi:biotin--[acetyl-CoA-carboxylase] ligase [uncultured Rhodoblastus sp.]|uniref:biotin--[acetyl-CoA-carboxylase] ligase n=1 Tax=uncultured Rhodoblastus sp. TaxID=543037 RepID=UPI0025EBEEC4|nr:biotin--[acetyl-CoA-carboxylase] ligase [uncultured Rhodoblastus sp.]